MKILSKILIANILLLIIGCATLKNDVAFYPVGQDAPEFGQATDQNPSYSSIIRLINKDGRFFCTGFVVDANYAVTAAHCVLTTLGGMTEDPIKIYGEYNQNTGETAKAIAVEGYRDVAFLKGNFKNFERQPADFYGEDVGKGFKMISCGFPSGIYKKFCTELEHVGNKYFQFRVKGGPIYKGCSGGPVINMQTGRAIGVNSAVDEDTVIIGPLVGVLKAVGLE